MHSLADLRQREIERQHCIKQQILRWKVVLRALHYNGMQSFVQLRADGPQMLVAQLMQQAKLWTSADDEDNKANIFRVLAQLCALYERSALMLQFYTAVESNNFEDMGVAHVKLLRIAKKSIALAAEQDKSFYPTEHPTSALQDMIDKELAPVQFREELISTMRIPLPPPDLCC